MVRCSVLFLLRIKIILVFNFLTIRYEKNKIGGESIGLRLQQHSSLLPEAIGNERGFAKPTN
jgi:hypothetical protein